MVALAFALPWRAKLPADGDLTRLKRVLKTAVEDLVPADLLYAPKRGFGYEIRERDVMLGPWRGKVDEVITGMPRGHWLDPNWVQGLWRSARQGVSVDWSLLARIFAQLCWEREYT
jgi:asparagine synthase (glutamine-hydrolysing)